MCRSMFAICTRWSAIRRRSVEIAGSVLGIARLLSAVRRVCGCSDRRVRAGKWSRRGRLAECRMRRHFAVEILEEFVVKTRLHHVLPSATGTDQSQQAHRLTCGACDVHGRASVQRSASPCGASIRAGGSIFGSFSSARSFPVRCEQCAAKLRHGARRWTAEMWRRAPILAKERSPHPTAQFRTEQRIEHTPCPKKRGRRLFAASLVRRLLRRVNHSVSLQNGDSVQRVRFGMASERTSDALALRFGEGPQCRADFVWCHRAKAPPTRRLSSHATMSSFEKRTVLGPRR